jgi:hypothetical protein
LGLTVTGILDQTARVVGVAAAAQKPAKVLITWRAGPRPGIIPCHPAAHENLDMVATDLDVVEHRAHQLALYDHDATTYENHIDGGYPCPNDLMIS